MLFEFGFAPAAAKFRFAAIELGLLLYSQCCHDINMILAMV